MTRFARTIGSNSSVKRIPDRATPWMQLKRKTNPDQSSVVQDQPKPSKKITWKMNADKCGIGTLSLSNESSPEKKEMRFGKNSIEHPVALNDGEEPAVVRFEGFSVRKEDAIRLKELKRKLLASKLPHKEIKRTMQLERRRAEKTLSRERKVVCFNCRQCGHIMSQCPNVNNESELVSESSICFKCGSSEHQHTQCRVVRGDNYKFATCFICKVEGHISKQCPNNPRGLYPEGGSCRICGDVTHMKKDCPRSSRKKNEFEITLSTLESSMKSDILDDDSDQITRVSKLHLPPNKKRKIIKM